MITSDVNHIPRAGLQHVIVRTVNINGQTQVASATVRRCQTSLHKRRLLATNFGPKDKSYNLSFIFASRQTDVFEICAAGTCT